MPDYAYLRVSSDEQAQSGLGKEAQCHSCEAWAARHDTVLHAVFVDDGLTGSLPAEKRPALFEAIATLERGDALVVAKRDRIGRGDVIMLAMIEASVKRRGARIVSAAGEGTDTDSPSDLLFRRMIDAFAEYELMLIRARTKSALEAKRRRNERTGQIPYGQILAEDSVHLEAEPDEVRAVAAVLQLRSEGLSLRAIARRFDADGVPTKNGGPKWSESSVRSILSRKTNP